MLRSHVVHNFKALSKAVARNQGAGRVTVVRALSSEPHKSWVPTEGDILQKVTTQSLVHEISLEQMKSAGDTIPWFLKIMPAAYFRQVPDELRKKHIKALISMRELGQSNLSLKIETKTATGTDITFFSTNTKAGSLHSQLTELKPPANTILTNVKVFTSLDNTIGINIFSFQEKGFQYARGAATPEIAKSIFAYVKKLKSGRITDAHVEYSEALSEAALTEYLTRCTPQYVEQVNDPHRFLGQKLMFDKTKGTENVEVSIEASRTNANAVWITIAASNVLPEVLLRHASFMISTRNLSIDRALMDTVSDAENEIGPEAPGLVTMLRVLVSDQTGKQIDQESEFTRSLLNDIRRAKWLDDSVTTLGLKTFPDLGIENAEIIVALCSMLHGPLSKVNTEAYASIKSIVQVISSNPRFMQIAESIAGLFKDRFNPQNPLSEADYVVREDELRSRIKKLQTPSARTVLDKMVDGLKATLRTNFYSPNRYALGLRVHPSIMATGNIGQPGGKPLPFGIVFAHGRHFNGFHNRFRDIARGGLRIVTPANSDQHALESARQYDEAYGLSHAQQLKNKDIPEGGSKAVVLVNTPSIEVPHRNFAMRKAVKAFTDTLLDLMVKDSVANLVDLYGKDELIYLGPDEQVIPFDIDWICNRAAQRGYPIPAAFMSSKKGAGINHKEFGVTSEGINVYIDVALNRVLGINPYKQPFTIKITGGPDGDVAGNLIKILYREYGNNCKVVGIADGFGCAEDPNGLDAGELLRLVEESLPISSFSQGKLSPTGVCLDTTTEAGSTMRNTMHMRVKADIFVPAGGRPNTINGENWRQFLDADGKPSSSLIVEGANIFTTPEARELLFKTANVKIVKDSSANKCGVITSSCEVSASMLLTKEEFLDIKGELVADVLVKLRLLAKLEAELLFREYKNYPGALPHFSERISDAINVVTDAVTDYLADVNPGDPLFEELKPLIRENLPKKLADVAWDRMPHRFPVQYQRNAIASTLASKLVYQEGIHLVETQPLFDLASRAIDYYREEQKVQALVANLEGSVISGVTEAEKALVIDLIKRGGARTKLDIF